MGIKTFRPVTSTQRFKVSPDFSEITKETPEKSLTHSLKKTGGRNNRGRITTRHIGGGHKQKYRIIDFKRDKFDVEATVIAVEYDPNRTARIALLEYPDKDRKYIIWPDKLNVGDKIVSASDSQVDIKPGNCMKLKYIPLGTLIHNIEMMPTRGGILVRSAGGWGQVLAKDKGFVQLQMPSGEIRMVSEDCRATVGQVGFIEHSSCIAGKAGHSRWLGRKPTVRGAAMNPIDHPHGGGEGKAGQGNPHPVTPWGKPTKGGKTRQPQKLSNRFIIKRRTK